MITVADIRFAEEPHAYWDGDREVAGVTQVLAKTVNWSRVPPDTLEYARTRGKAVHHATALDDLGQLDESSIDPVVEPYLMAWRRFTRENQPQWEVVEGMVYHPLYRYAGTLDRRGTFPGLLRPKGLPYRKRVLLDIKTGDEDHASYDLQLAAYVEADGETHGISRPERLATERYICFLRPDATYRLVPRKNSLVQDWGTFLAFLHTHRFLKENGI